MKSPRKNRISIVIYSGLLLLLVLACVAYLEVKRRTHAVPDYYQARVNKPFEQQRAASRQMLEKTAELNNVMQDPGDWSVSYTEDEMNGWLAVDFQQNHAQRLPKEVSDPRVVLESDQATLACRVDSDDFEGVFSVDLDVFVAQPNMLAFRLRDVRAGSLSLPRSQFLERIESDVDKVGYPVEWREMEGDTVLLVRVDPRIDKRKRVEISSVELLDGQLRISGTSSRATP